MSDSKNPKNYDDLKARLGLKKEPEPAKDEPAPAAGASKPAASSGAEVGEPEGEQTPPGGFDLGLERGGREMDERDIDVDKAAAEMVTEGGPDIAVKTSTGMKVLMAILVLAACGAAFGVGYSIKGTQDDRMIQKHQTEDAEKLLKAVSSAKTGNGGQTLVAAFTAFKDAVDTGLKNIQSAQKAQEVTPALLNSLKGHLDTLHQASIAYVEQGVLLDGHATIGKTVFNGEAVRAVLQYDRALLALHTAAKLMAEEHVVFDEFKRSVDPKSLKIDAVTRAWRWATVTVEGRPKGYLVGVQLQTDDKGELIYQKKDIVVPEGHRLPEGAPTFEWQVKVKYDDPKQVGGKEEDWVATDLIVQWDLTDDILGPAKEAVTAHHQVYEQMLLRRLFQRVDALKQAADPLPIVHKKTIETLTELAK